MWLEMGLAELWCVCLGRIASKCDRQSMDNGGPPLPKNVGTVISRYDCR